MSAVAAGKLSKTGFRNDDSLRASVAFSYGSHDEWNISHLLNERHVCRTSLASPIRLQFSSTATG